MIQNSRGSAAWPPVGRHGLRALLLACGAAAWLASGASAGVVYVNASAAPGGSGTSWSDALTDLQAAIAQAVSGDEIWVAQGVYRPAATDRTASFTLKNGVTILGGFTGFEDSALQRNPASTSTLSGEIGGPGITDNSFHVVRAENVDGTAVLDGFTITSGYAGGGGPSDSVFGGGVYIRNASPTLRSLVISNNSASDTGGGMFIAHGNVRLERVFFFGNRGIATGGKGGAIGAGTATLTLVNCVFSNNFTFSASGGGAIHLVNTTLSVASSTFNANSASFGAVVAVTNNSAASFINSIIAGSGGASTFFGGTAPSVTFSIVQGGYAGAGNLATAPSFVNAPAANFRLAPGSAGIDAGSNAGVATIPLDYDLSPRVLAGTVDMGAFEFIARTCTCDLDRDGFIDNTDFVRFANAYNNFLDRGGDFNADLVTDNSDFVIFAQAYNDFECP